MKQVDQILQRLRLTSAQACALASAVTLLAACSSPETATAPGTISLDLYSPGYVKAGGSDAKSLLRASGARERPGWRGVLRFRLSRPSLEQLCEGELIFAPPTVGLSHGLPDGFSLQDGAPEDITKNLDLASERVRLHEAGGGGESVSLSGGMIQTARVDAATGLERWDIGFVCSFWKELPEDLDLEIKTDAGSWRTFPLFGE